jgi:hypothetical protein
MVVNFVLHSLNIGKGHNQEVDAYHQILICTNLTLTPDQVNNPHTTCLRS